MRRHSLFSLAAVAVFAVLATTLVAVAAPGELDPTFSGDGVLRLSDKRVAWSATPDGDRLLIVEHGVRVGAHVVKVLGADGEPDLGFSVDGVSRVRFGGRAGSPMAVIAAPHDRIVVVGRTLDSFELGVARLHADGAPDRTFAGGGSTVYPIPCCTDGRTDVGVDAAGRITIVAWQSDRGGAWPIVVHLLADGRLDPAYTGDGWEDLRDAYISHTVFTPGGRLLTLESEASGFRVTRYASTGAVDRTFSGDGRLAVRCPGFAPRATFDIDGRGRLYFVCIEIESAGESFAGNLRIIRFGADGTRDAGYSGDGHARVHTPPVRPGAELFVDPLGRVVLADIQGDFADAAVRFVQLTPAGSYDLEFAPDGSRVVALPYARGCGMATGDRILCGAGDADGGTSIVAIAQH